MTAPISLLRIYLRRGTRARLRVRTWFGKSFARQLVEDAFRCGVDYASITVSHCGYVAGARTISDGTEISIDSLPQCVELAASRARLEQFIQEHREAMRDCVVVWFEGAQVTRTLLTVPASTS